MALKNAYDLKAGAGFHLSLPISEPTFAFYLPATSNLLPFILHLVALIYPIRMDPGGISTLSSSHLPSHPSRYPIRTHLDLKLTSSPSHLPRPVYTYI